ncbi:MAG TPA: TonB-dependent receptor plug domain-containing protein, partial [Xanthomonadaceae bacterium]|nr:TonB-dependent receptor plug domain-containing protein [Xanthomonadaceae bacterium]
MPPIALAAAIAAVLAPSLIAVAPAHAQALDDGTDRIDATDLDRVVVSASTSRVPDSDAALPNTITIIDQQDLREQLAMTRDLSQVLANLIPAFSPSRQKMSSFGESLRGRQPLYMVDGVPQSTPLRDGSRDAHTIDPAMIERIEVIHGANALQGLGASGGIINIITKRAPRRDGESFQEVTLGASTALPSGDDAAGYRGSYLFGTHQGAFDFVGGVSYAQEGLYYDGEGDAIAVDPVQGDLMDAHSHNLFAKGGWALDDQRRLQLTANKFRLTGEGHYAVVVGDFEQGIP